MRQDPQLLEISGDGLTLRGDVFGPVDGPSIFFFHGGGQSRKAWSGAAERVARAGYRACSVDLRGHGESDWAEDGDYLLDAFARDICAMIDSSDRPIALVGASRGGQAALVAASRRPTRVALVMLADVAPRMRDEGIDAMRDFFRVSDPGFASLNEAAEALSTHLGLPRRRDLSGLSKTMRRDANGRFYWRWDPRTVAPEFLHPPSEGVALEEAAGRIRDPVILVRAELSTIVTEASVALFRELAPQLDVVVAKGVGHMYTGDRNDAFADTLLDHLVLHLPIAA